MVGLGMSARIGQMRFDKWLTKTPGVSDQKFGFVPKPETSFKKFTVITI